jgi:ethanolamine utilization protein EutN
MILGRVVGEVWATRKHPALDGRKLLLVAPHLWYAPPFEVGQLVAVDPVGAGVGEDVVVCMGDPARRQLGSTSLPVEATVAAIVDRVELGADFGPRPLSFVGGGAGPRR